MVQTPPQHSAAPMTAPRHRWFRFSLRGLFAVVVVLAWGLATRPYLVPVVHMTPTWSYDGAERRVEGEFRDTETLFGQTFFLHLEPDQPGRKWREEYGLNPRLRWPLIALVGLVGLGIVERLWALRTERHAHQSTR